jgi:hypothetical protein
MLDCMYHGGKIALLGILPKGAGIDWDKVIFKGLTLHGIYGRRMYETWYKMTQMVLTGFPLQKVLTHQIHIDDFQRGFDLMEAGHSCGKVVCSWRYFNRRLRRIGERATKLGDRAARSLKEDGNPYDAVDSAMSAGRATSPTDRAWHDKPRRELLNLARSELDHGRAIRAWAQRLGIDPDTRNPLIRPRLEALGWVAVGGDQSAGWGIAALGAGVVDALGASRQIHDAVWQLDGPELRARNRARISPWCPDETLLRRFLQHKAFSARLQTELVEATRALAPDAGCDALLETALMAATEAEARFLINALRLLHHHLGEQAAGGRLRPLGATLVFHGRDGELLLPLAIDHLAWTPQMQRFFDHQGVAGPRRTLLVTGSISLRSQRELTARGWSLVPNLPYPGAPDYAPSPAAPQLASNRH